MTNHLRDEEKSGLGIALNEASLFGVEVSRERKAAAVTLSVLTLPEGDAPPPQDSRVSLLLSEVSRVVASLREARWDDPTAPAILFPLERLLETVQTFGGANIYGWEFIDVERGFDGWSGRLSLDERLSDHISAHSLTVFQSDAQRHLDVRIWFETLQVLRPDYTEIPLNEFIAGGKRWWDGLYSGDARTNGSGIFPNQPPA